MDESRPSINFLSLAISGIANCDKADTELFEKSSVIHKCQKNLSNSENRVLNLDSVVKYNDFVAKHNKITTELLEKDIDEIEVEEKLGFALFFIHKGSLYQYILFPGDAATNKVVKIEPNVTSSSARQFTLNQLIKKPTEEDSYLYLDDLTVFSKSSEIEVDGLNMNSSGKFIALIITLLMFFVVFQVLPSKELYSLLQSSQNLMDKQADAVITRDIISTKAEIYEFMKTVLIPNIFNPERQKDDFEEEILFSLSSTRSTDVQSILEESELTSQNILDVRDNEYIYSRKNLFSGIMIGFNLIERKEIQVNGQPMVIKDAAESYWGPIYDSDSDDFINFTFRKDLNNFGSGYYMPVYSKMSFYNKIFASQMLEVILKQQILNINFSIFLYNSDFKAVLALENNFTLDQFDEVTFSPVSQGFLPFIRNSEGYTVLLVAFVVYFVCLIIMSLLVLKTFYGHFRDGVESRKAQIPWYDFFDIVVLVGHFLLAVLFVVVFLFTGKEYPVVFSELDDFTFWSSYTRMIKLFNQTAALMLLISMLWMVRFIYTSFPTLGAVFRTISTAGEKLLGFSLILAFVLVTFMFATHISFGYYVENNNTLEDTFLNIFLVFIGLNNDSDFGSYFNGNPLATPILIIFNFIFNFMIFNIFLSIIRYSYIETRKKNDTLIEVYNLMVAEKSSEIKQNVLDLVMFKEPPRGESKVKETKSAENSPESSEEKGKEGEKPTENAENPNENKKETKKQSPSFWQILSYNWSKLDIYGLLSEGSEMKKEEFQEKKRKYLKIVERKRLKQHMAEIEVDYSFEFNLLGRTIGYILFILLYVLMFTLQYKNEEIYEQSIYMKEVFDLEFGDSGAENYYIVMIYKKFMISALYDPSDVFGQNVSCPEGSITFRAEPEERRRMQQDNGKQENDKFDEFDEFDGFDYFIDPLYHDYDSPDNHCDKTFNRCKLPGLIFLSDTYFRTTTRVSRYDINKFDKDKEFFKFSLNDPSPLDQANCRSNNEFISGFTGSYNLQGKDTTFSLPYSEPIVKQSAYDCGGYVHYSYERNPLCDNPQEEDKAGLKDNYPLVMSFFQKLPIGSIFIETHLFNYEHNLFITVRYNFITQPSGVIESSLDIDIIPFNTYNKNEDFFRLFIELLLLGFLAYQTFTLVSEIGEVLQKSIEKEFAEKDLNPNLSWFEKYYNLNFAEMLDTSAFNALTSVLTKLVIYSIKLAYEITIATYNYIADSAFNLIDFVSVILGWISVFLWLTIIKETGNINLNLKTQANTPVLNNLSTLLGLNEHYREYFYVLGFNAFLIVCRILRLLRFSKRIYSFVWLLKKSKMPIMFNLIVMAMVLYGFVAMGMVLYGQTMKEFNTLSQSLLSCAAMFFGQIETKRMIDVDLLFTFIFITALKFSFIMILLNLLTAMVVESYFYIKHQERKSDIPLLGVYANIKAIVKNKLIMFNESCKLYFDNIKIMTENIIIPAIQKIEEDNKKAGKSSIWWFRSEKANQDPHFFEELTKTRQNIKKKTTNSMKIEVKNNEMVDVPVKMKGDFKNGLTVWKKMYIYMLHQSNNEGSYEILAKIFGKTVEEDNSQPVGTNKIKNTTTQRGGLFGFIDDVDPDENNTQEMFLTEGRKAFKDSAHKVINKALFNGTVKERVLAKAFKRDISTLPTLNSLFIVDKVSFKRLIRPELLVSCVKYPACKKEQACSCYSGECNYQEFYNIMAKYLFTPNPLPHSKIRDIYIGLYLVALKELGMSYSSRAVEKVIMEIKFNCIANEVLAYLKQNSYTDPLVNLTAFQSAFNFFMVAFKKLDSNLVEDLYKTSELNDFINEKPNLQMEELIAPFEAFLDFKFKLKEEKEYETNGKKQVLNYQAYITNVLNKAILNEGLDIQNNYPPSYNYFHSMEILGLTVDKAPFSDINAGYDQNSDSSIFRLNRLLWDSQDVNMRTVLFFGYHEVIYQGEAAVTDFFENGMNRRPKELEFFNEYHKGYFYSMTQLPSIFSTKLGHSLKTKAKTICGKDIGEFDSDNLSALLRLLLNENKNYDMFFEEVWNQAEICFKRIKLEKNEVDEHLSQIEMHLKSALNGAEEDVIEEWTRFFNRYASIKKAEHLKSVVSKTLTEKQVEELESVLYFASDTPINSLVPP